MYNLSRTNDNTFNDCPMGVLANLCELKATGNTLDYVDRGIWASLAGAGGIAIDNNEMAHTQVGILVAHAHAAGQVSIAGNTVKTEVAGNGTGIITLYNHAPAVVENNAVTVGKAGLGISIYAGNGAQVLENNVTLADQNLAGAGISLTYAQQCLLQDNAITGAGLGGPGNIGIEIVASPGNVYCCNTVGNTRMGVSVSGGSLATDNFRGTTFGNHATSLYLPNVNAVLGSQSHTQNKWTGTGAAVYGVPFNIAQLYPFTIDITPPNGSPEYMPPTHSPQGWFIPVENPNSDPLDECAPEFCIIPGLTSGSEDDKRIIEGLPNAQAAVIWELQRFIFERVRDENIQDSTIQAFVLQNNQSNIGAFQHINEEIHDAWNGNSSDIAPLKNELKLVEEKLDSLILLDGLITDPHNNTGILMQSRQLLSDGLFNLSLSCRDLSTDVNEDAIAQFEWLKPVNDSISAQTIFETNEKTVNGLYLNYATQSMSPLTESELLALKMIAEQCPLTGGNAVYRARAFLAVANSTPLDYNDSLACSGNQAFSVPGNLNSLISVSWDLFIFPNPATQTTRVQWTQESLSQCDLIVLDVFGRQVCRYVIPAGIRHYDLPVNNLPQGLYVVKAVVNNTGYSGKVIVKH